MFTVIGVVEVRLVEGEDDRRAAARKHESTCRVNCITWSIDASTPELPPEAGAEQVQALIRSVVSFVMVPGYKHGTDSQCIGMRIREAHRHGVAGESDRSVT